MQRERERDGLTLSMVKYSSEKEKRRTLPYNKFSLCKCCYLFSQVFWSSFSFLLIIISLVSVRVFIVGGLSNIDLQLGIHLVSCYINIFLMFSLYCCLFFWVVSLVFPLFPYLIWCFVLPFLAWQFQYFLGPYLSLAQFCGLCLLFGVVFLSFSLSLFSVLLLVNLSQSVFHFKFLFLSPNLKKSFFKEEGRVPAKKREKISSIILNQVESIRTTPF